jgi:transposase-like protein
VRELQLKIISSFHKVSNYKQKQILKLLKWKFKTEIVLHDSKNPFDKGGANKKVRRPKVE